ncbi:MAG: hypothetical protein P9L99_10955 [Candidatus Lernaella stagnicola]|nr:hypothetical protein [Candidatus Lernaella stagnicola]
MAKHGIIILTALLVVGLCLSACGSKQQEASPENPAEQPLRPNGQAAIPVVDPGLPTDSTPAEVTPFVDEKKGPEKPDGDAELDKEIEIGAPFTAASFCEFVITHQCTNFEEFKGELATCSKQVNACKGMAGFLECVNAKIEKKVGCGDLGDIYDKCYAEKCK